ncbi:hypothetical protein O3P69_013917 [Scylla paramamosain]|uniref:Uncharacterized protein n=1 Tax=Scylla paramamosain TaxID=85552 RepID=A0AAW0SSC1_SCYPA
MVRKLCEWPLQPESPLFMAAPTFVAWDETKTNGRGDQKHAIKRVAVCECECEWRRRWENISGDGQWRGK